MILRCCLTPADPPPLSRQAHAAQSPAHGPDVTRDTTMGSKATCGGEQRITAEIPPPLCLSRHLSPPDLRLLRAFLLVGRFLLLHCTKKRARVWVCSSWPPPMCSSGPLLTPLHRLYKFLENRIDGNNIEFLVIIIIIIKKGMNSLHIRCD